MTDEEYALSEAPAELWLRPRSSGWYQTVLEPLEPDAERYVRADLYEAAQAVAAALMRNETPCPEPLPPDAGSHEQQPSAAMLDALRALRDDNAAAAKEAPCREPLGTDYR